MSQDAKRQLHRVMGFRDLVLFYLVTGFSLRWFASSATAGPSAILIWIAAALTFYVPHLFCVLELSSRYPEEGGIYVWCKKAFGETAGFLSGWTFWIANLPYFPTLLYFAAANILFVGSSSWLELANSSTYFMVFSLAGLAFAIVISVLGLNVGKWLHNAGAIGLWIPAMTLVIVGGLSWLEFGPANLFSSSTLLPSFNLKEITFWSTIAFAFSGLEGASTMSEEIQNPRRTMPRALLVAGSLVTSLYILGVSGILLAVPSSEINDLDGVIVAIAKAAERVGAGFITPIIALLIVVGMLGSLGAWFATAARIPFVGGVDRYLPGAFGRVHPRWGSPYVSILVQGLISAILVFLSQAGTTAKGAYEILVSMAIITYFIPYLMKFAALIKVQREPAGPDVMRVPGGRPVAYLLGGLGFTTTAVALILAVVPAADSPDPVMAVLKTVVLSVILVGAGWLIFLAGRRRHQEQAQGR